MDRIDIRIPVNGSNDVLFRDNAGETPETSADVRQRVIRAVEMQRRRFTNNNGVRRNARMRPIEINCHCPLNIGADRAFRRAAEALVFSGRAYHSVLKLARTIADLDDRELIEAEHILEAIQHRRLGDDPYDVLL
jgi:magnesium chelatase family protein